MHCCSRRNLKKLIINGTTYQQCLNCGLLTKESKLSLLEEKRRYDLHVCDEKYLNYMKNVVDNIKPFLKEGSSLDFGCGKIHALSDILNEEGFSCFYYDLYYFNLPLDIYDNIIMIEVFEHLRDPYLELMNILKHLRPGGRIIIMTKPYEDSFLENNWWYLRDSTHYSFIKNDTLKKWNLPYKVNQVKDDIFVLESI